MESSQNTSLWQSRRLTPTAASALPLSLHTCPTSCQKTARGADLPLPRRAGAGSEDAAERSGFFFTPLTHLSAHASTLEPPLAAQLHCGFISVGGTKNNCRQLTYSKCHRGTKGDSGVNKWD